MRGKSFDLISLTADTFLLTAFQTIREIPAGKNNPYYKKDKLNFEKAYGDILKALLERLSLREYKKVVINIDSRKHKEGILGKKAFQENILFYLEQCYPNTIFRFEILPSTSNILIEMADFVSNTFYKKYIGQKTKYLEELKLKTIAIKNPLGKPKR